MLTIEPIDARHSPSIQELFSNPEIPRTTDIPSALPEDAASGWIARMKGLEERGKGLTFAILADDRVVGICGLYRIDIDQRTADLGLIIGTAFWGHGHATAAGRILLAHGFGAMGLQSVQADCLTWNVRAIRVLNRLGFQPSHEGPPPPGSKFPPTERYQYWLLTKNQWKSVSEPASTTSSAQKR
jgi:RimJ/RimL family protein N-acetyltransferase